MGISYQAGVVDGEPVAPPSGAFGACFERREKSYEPTGETFEGHGWARVADIADDVCREW